MTAETVRCLTSSQLRVRRFVALLPLVSVLVYMRAILLLKRNLLHKIGMKISHGYYYSTIRNFNFGLKLLIV